MSRLRLPTITITQAQREWLDSESKNTGNPISTILRGLIQAEMAKRPNQPKGK